MPGAQQFFNRSPYVYHAGFSIVKQQGSAKAFQVLIFRTSIHHEFSKSSIVMLHLYYESFKIVLKLLKNKEDFLLYVAK